MQQHGGCTCSGHGFGSMHSCWVAALLDEQAADNSVPARQLVVLCMLHLLL
jgi:hypothetical protein